MVLNFKTTKTFSLSCTIAPCMRYATIRLCVCNAGHNVMMDEHKLNVDTENFILNSSIFF